MSRTSHKATNGYGKGGDITMNDRFIIYGFCTCDLLCMSLFPSTFIASISHSYSFTHPVDVLVLTIIQVSVNFIF